VIYISSDNATEKSKIKKTKMSQKAADNAAIDVSKLKLERFRGNNRDTLDIKTWSFPSLQTRSSPEVGRQEHGDNRHGGTAGAGAQLGSPSSRREALIRS
jgi:hypothetical protein